MPPNDEKKSAVPDNHREELSVYDFLYHDARRIGSFLAQFYEAGLLQSVKQTIGTEQAEQTKYGGQSGLNAVVRIGGQFERQAGATNKDALERQYDPFWTHALTLLELLSNRGMIHHQPSHAAMGQFVAVKGTLLISDVGLLKAVWDNEKLRKFYIDQEIETAVSKISILEGQKREEVRKVTEYALELVQGLPHTLQARLLSEKFPVWCTLSPESLVGSASDIVLKHGPSIAGEWSIVGILDAYPYQHGGEVVDGQPMVNLIAEAAGHGAGQVALRLANQARTFMGRPPGYYGVTPLLIFREIIGPKGS
jgi:hypothetical protein